MQSDGNSIHGDVVLDSFNWAYLNEFNILDQIKKQRCSDYFHDDFIFYNIKNKWLLIQQ